MYKALLICLVAVISFANDTIHLIVPEFPPYTYTANNQIQGIGVEKVKQLFDSISVPIVITHVPNYGRAVHDVREGKADGFFLASQNSKRDSIAQFSEPILINNWSWFTHHESPKNFHDETFKNEAKIATPLNSNTHKWLKDNGYRVIFPVNNADLYLKLIKRKKVDAIFIAEEVFILQLRRENMPLEKYSKTIELQRDFGIYISHKTLEKSPNLIKNINAAIRNQNKAGALK